MLLSRGIFRANRNRSQTKRRATKRIAVAVLVTATAAVSAGLPASPAAANSGYKYTNHNNSAVGQQGIYIYGSGRSVSEITSLFVPPNNNYLYGRTWRHVLSSYTCNPIGKNKSDCPVSHYSAGGANKSGNPAVDRQVCASVNATYFSLSQCQDFGVARGSAKFGDLGPQIKIPGTFNNGTWFCTEIQVYNPTSKTWVFNGDYTQGRAGQRACAQVIG